MSGSECGKENAMDETDDTGTREFHRTPEHTAASSNQDALHIKGQPDPVRGLPAPYPEAEAGTEERAP